MEPNQVVAYVLIVWLIIAVIAGVMFHTALPLVIWWIVSMVVGMWAICRKEDA